MAKENPRAKFSIKAAFNASLKPALRLSANYVKPEAKQLAIGISLMFAIAALTSSYAYLIKEALDKIFIGKQLGMLVAIPVAVALITILKNICMYFQVTTMQIVMQRISAKIRHDIYRSFVNADMKFFDSTPSGAMITRMIYNTDSFVSSINIIMVVLVRELLTVTFLFGVLLYQSPVLTLLSLVGGPFLVIPVAKISRKLKRAVGKNQGSIEAFTIRADDALKAPKLIKANAAEDFESNRMKGILDAVLSNAKKSIRLASMIGPVNESINSIGVALVIWYGGHAVINGEMTSGTFFAFFTSMTIAYKPLKAISNINLTIQSFLQSAEVISETLNRKNDIASKPNAVILERKNIRGEIEFHDVSFRYDLTHEREILRRISFKIEPGKMLALVGPTGAGKSTIVSLLMRFYDVTNGEVTIDNIDIRDAELKSLRNLMSFVSQEIQLLDDTIENNIKYTVENATFDEILHAAKMANALEFIEKTPEGFATKIGQNGIKLSGGQRQRIAIARAILYNAPIILLDEATSALDSISERLIQDALDKFMAGRTTIAIAHRLSTVIHASNILVIENGEISEHGTHKELIKNSGHYAKLYATQFDIKP